MDVDTGIARKLPPMPEEELQEDDSQIHAKNIYVVLINANNQLLVEGELMDISQLRDGAKDFIDNNGTNPNSSENPEKAIISLQNDRGTEYMTYIRVQNELAAAYNELRNKAALNKFGERYADLNKTQKKEIRKMYPQKISEAEPKNIGGDS
jgi:biopolymer transport protein ExbD